MDKIYRITINGRKPASTKLYESLGSARNAYSNIYGVGRGSMLGAEIQSATPTWVIEDVIKINAPLPWRNAGLIRAKALREKAQRMLAEADRLDKLNGLFSNG